MKLIYFESAHGNFGDDLNLELWPRLSPALFEDSQSTDGFSGIGTIIGMPVEGVERIHVFTSGVGYNRIARLKTPHQFWAVRGPLTAKILGLNPELALTDGALLAPMIFPKPPSSGEVLVVPHWESILMGGWQETCAHADLTLVDPTQKPDVVIRRLAGAKLVLTESLHGAILADAYGVPWLPFTTVQSFSTFKWLDWTLSVGVPLRPMIIPPPLTKAAVALGRPRGGRWGEQISPLESDVMEDIQRLKVAENEAPRDSRRNTLTFRAKQFVAQHPAMQPLMGYSPRRTAEMLVKLSRAEPFLSKDSTRAALTTRLADTFRRICTSAGAAVQI